MVMVIIMIICQVHDGCRRMQRVVAAVRKQHECISRPSLRHTCLGSPSTPAGATSAGNQQQYLLMLLGCRCIHRGFLAESLWLDTDAWLAHPLGACEIS